MALKIDWLSCSRKEDVQIKLREEQTMEILNVIDVREDESRSNLYIGEVSRKRLIDEKLSSELRLGMVMFAAGSKNTWHTHTIDQVLYVIEGNGIVATEKEEVIVTPGTIIFIPAGEKHWHGATQDSTFSHFAINIPGKTNIAN